jgi:hypothetical protein
MLLQLVDRPRPHDSPVRPSCTVWEGLSVISSLKPHFGGSVMFAPSIDELDKIHIWIHKSTELDTCSVANVVLLC